MGYYYDDDTGLPVIGRKPTTEPDGVKMRHADNRALVRYWHALRGGRTCPDRAEVDPRHMLCDIGHLFILEDLGQGNIRFRLAGSALVDVFWMDLRGMPAQAIMAPEARESLRALISETLAEPGIGHAILHRVGTDGAAGRAAWEIVLLPLRSDRGGIDRVIGAIRALEDGEVDTAQPPVSFTIAEMEITPVSTEDSDWLRESAGMAEGADPWERALERSQRNGLRSIEGGREGEEEATPRALTRNDLKIIDGH